MKKLILAFIGLAFAFAISSCDNRGRKCGEPHKCRDREERQHRRW